MATFAELLTGIASQVQTNVPDTSAAVTRGAELGLKVQQIQMQRQEIEQKKAEAESAKFEKVGSWFETYSKMPEGAAKRAFGKKFIPTGIGALGIQDKIDPNVLEMMTGDPNLSAFLVSEIRNGRMDMSALTQPDKVAQVWAQSGKQFGDLEQFRTGVSESLPELQDAEKLALTEAGKSERAQAMAAEAARRAEEARGAAGDVELSKKANQDYQVYKTEGGAAGIDANLTLLEETLKALEDKKIQTGTLRTFIPTDKLKKLVGVGDVVALGNKAKKAIQASLKATLGSQFTKEEGERIENRTFDPELDTKYNIDALRSEITKIKNTKKNAEELFGQYVKGFKQKPSPANKNAGANNLPQIGQNQIDAFNKLSGQGKERALQAFSDKFGISLEEAKTIFGVK